MSEWKTVRVRADLLGAVKARAESEGSNATAWIERALGAALESADGRIEAASRGGREQPDLTTPAPRRASEGQSMGRMAQRAMELQERAEREARE